MSRFISLEDEDILHLPTDLCLQARSKSIVYGRYSIVYHKVEEIISQKTPEAFRTAAEIRRRVRSTNEVTFNSAALAVALDVSRPTISRHLKQLKELGIIVPQYEQVGQAWLIHPLYGWYGGGKAKDKYWQSLAQDHPFKKLMVEEELEYPEEDDDTC